VQSELFPARPVQTLPDHPVRDVAVDIVRSARRRTLAIHVSAKGAVEVRAPMRTAERDIRIFLERHREWILKKVVNAQANPPWSPEWREGGEWYWCGEPVRLHAHGPRGGRLIGDTLAVAARPADDADKWRRLVFAWHKREATTLLQARANALFALHCQGHRLTRIDLRWMRATWGTCGGKRAADGKRDVVLRLNLWLAALPPALCDAILLHELAHVEHMNHGAGFYRRLAVLNPDWRAHDEALKPWARWLFPIASR
jgi:predicted metal-dependent hydrolase